MSTFLGRPTGTWPFVESNAVFVAVAMSGAFISSISIFGVASAVLVVQPIAPRDAPGASRNS